jgi:hypothetical protein
VFVISQYFSVKFHIFFANISKIYLGLREEVTKHLSLFAVQTEIC